MGSYDAVLKVHAVDADKGMVITEILRNVDQLSKARRERLVAATDIVWIVLFGGAFLTSASRSSSAPPICARSR